jgi:hypothetical protein
MALKRMPPEAHLIGTGRDPTPRRRSCNCKRSNCLKLYCECFANGAYCEGDRCHCVSCHNNINFEHARREAIEIILDRNSHAFRPKIVAASASPTSGATRCVLVCVYVCGGAGRVCVCVWACVSVRAGSDRSMLA